MRYIIQIDTDIVFIGKFIDDIYTYIYNLIKIFNYVDNNLNILQNILQVIKYDDYDIPINKYKLNLSNYYLVDLENNLIDINNIYIKNLQTELLNKKNVVNCFIPLEISENKSILQNKYKELEFTDEKINTDIYINRNQLKESLLNQINNIKDVINNTKVLLEHTNKKYEENLENYLESKSKLDALEIKEKMKKQKLIDKLNMFEADNNIYKILAEEIDNKIREPDDIPELFVKKYIIFKQIDELYPNIDEKDKFKKFYEIKNELNINFNMNNNNLYDFFLDDNLDVYKKKIIIEKSDSETETEIESSN